MLSEKEFEAALKELRRDMPGAFSRLIEHDTDQRAEIKRLKQSLKWHREDLDLRIGELRLWLKRHGVGEPALTEFWNIVANKRPQCAISDSGDPNDLGFSLAQRNERLAAELSRLRDSARVRDARYIGVIEALLHGIDEYWEEHDGRETVLDAIRLVEESKP